MEIGYIVCVPDFYKILSDIHLFNFFFFLNGEILRGYAGVRVTKRSILIFHFTIYPISNIYFFTTLFKYYIFNLSLFFLYISFFLFFFVSLLSKGMSSWDNFENDEKMRVENMRENG